MNTDVRGSTTNVIRADGTSVTGFVYDEFGNQIKTGESDFIVDATYTGSIYDEETGLQYMNARYYDPGVGRFISRDSYLGSSHEPWTQHLYAYTGNNPINYIDPTGHAFDYIYDPGRYGSPGDARATQKDIDDARIAREARELSKAKRKFSIPSFSDKEATKKIMDRYISSSIKTFTSLDVDLGVGVGKYKGIGLLGIKAKAGGYFAFGNFNSMELMVEYELSIEEIVAIKGEAGLKADNYGEITPIWKPFKATVLNTDPFNVNDPRFTIFSVGGPVKDSELVYYLEITTDRQACFDSLAYSYYLEWMSDRYYEEITWGWLTKH